MQLTAEQIRSVKAFAEGGESGAAMLDRRLESRIDLRSLHVRPVLIMSGDTGRPIEAFLRDLSTSGVGLRCATRLAPGTLFVLELPAEETIRVLCNVVYCRDNASDRFHVGGRFLSRWFEGPCPEQISADASC